MLGFKFFYDWIFYLFIIIGGCLSTRHFFIKNDFFLKKIIICHLITKPLTLLFVALFFLLSYHGFISQVIG